MANIGFTRVHEENSPNWGKYYVEGLKSWQVKQDRQSGAPESRSNYHCNDVPEGTIFTIFEQSGTVQEGIKVCNYTICVTANDEFDQDVSIYGPGSISGNFKVLAHGAGKLKAERLMGWWEQRPADVDPVAFAEHCGAYIRKWRIQNLPPMPTAIATPEERDPSELSEANRLLLYVELKKLCDRYGIEAVQKTVLQMDTHGILLPVHQSFYGDINTGDFSWFLSSAGEALRRNGFELKKNVNPDTPTEQELWTKGGDVCLSPPDDHRPLYKSVDGQNCGIEIDWRSLVEEDVDSIARAIASALRSEKDG